MPRTKGSAFVALKSFITRRFGYEGWKRYLGRIEPHERKEIEMPMASEWYELDTWIRSLQVLREAFGEELPEVVFEFGRHEAESDLNFGQRLFLRLANPAYVIEKAGEYWRRFCDFGRWEVERKGSTVAVATLLDVPVAEALYCEELSGYLKRLFELVGAKNVKLEHTHCRSRGDEKCVWNGSWD